MSCQNCLELGIPEHLCMHGKPVHVPFITLESVFRRHNENINNSSNLDNTDLKIVERLFKLTNDSYNRSSLSVPSDVLIDENGIVYDSHGIISLEISKINRNLIFNINGGDRKCSVNVVFVPKECNYSHCELWCYVDGVRREDGKPPKSAKQHFREFLLENMRVIKEGVKTIQP